MVNESDFTSVSCLSCLNVSVLDRSDGFHPLQGCLCRPERPEAWSVSKQSFEGCVIALDAVVLIFFVDMGDVVKMRVILVIYLSDNLAICRRLICAN